MESIQVVESMVETSSGGLYIKEWIPAELTTNVPIIILHESLGCVGLWKEFPEMLANKLSRRIIAYDRLGFGQSDVRVGSPSFDFIKEEASIFFPEIKSHLSLGKFILLGHSVGGCMSLNIAANDSDCIAVISISAQAFVEDITIKGIQTTKAVFEKPEQIARLEKWHGHKAKWVLRTWLDTWLSAEFSAWNLNYCLPDVTCPVLVIHGDKDEYGSNLFPDYIVDNVAGLSTKLIIENCGHFPHKEKTTEVFEAILNFTSESHFFIETNG